MNILYQIYILESLLSGRYYVGHTNNVVKRLRRHNAGQVLSTKPHRPWKLIYTEKFATKSAAYRREMEIKKYKSGIKFKKLIGKFEG